MAIKYVIYLVQIKIGLNNKRDKTDVVNNKKKIAKNLQFFEIKKTVLTQICMLH